MWLAGAAWWYSIPAFAWAILTVIWGHGQWMDLGNYTGIIKAEKLDIFVRIFFGKDPNETVEGKGNYWRDVFGMGMSMFLATLPCAIIVGLYEGGIVGS